MGRPRVGPLKKPHSRNFYARLILPTGKHVWRSLGTDSKSKAERLWPVVMEQLEIQHGLREGSLKQIREETLDVVRNDLVEELGIETVAAEIVSKLKGTRRLISHKDQDWTPLHEAVASALTEKDVSLIPMTWEAAIEAWRKRRERKKGEAPSPKTESALHAITSELRQRGLLPNALTEDDVWNWVRDLEQQEPHIAASTIKTKTAMLKALTKALATQKLIKTDPLGNFNYEVASTTSITWRSLSTEELGNLSSKLHLLSTTDSLFTQILLRTGLRLDELASRSWEDIRKNTWLEIKPIEDKEGRTIWRPKTAESRRNVYLAPDLLESLKSLCPGQTGQLFKACKPSKDGKYGKNISERIRSFMRNKCNLKDKTVVLHSFRNNYIDACRAVEMDVGVEMALVGHVDANAKQINKIHRGYGAGYPDEVLLKWSIRADEWMNSALNIHNHKHQAA